MTETNSTYDAVPEYGHETPENNDSDIIFALIAAFLIGLVINTISGLVPQKWQAFKIPYTAAMLLFGFICGVIERTTADVPYMSEGLRQLEAISPAIIFAVFLPALVFPSGLNTEWHLATRTAPYGLLLAVPGTLVAASAIAVCAKYVLPYNWEWSESFLFGGILSAVDPVAVISIMHSVNASPKLSTVIELESLLNDGVAYVLYEIFISWASGHTITVGGVVAFTFKAVGGGLGMGLAFGIGCALWLALIFNEVDTEITITLVTVYSCWLVCDEVLGVSGMLALVFCSIFMGAYGKFYASRRTADKLEFFWSYVDWLANTVIFFLSGLIISEQIYRNIDDISWEDAGYAVLLWVLIVAIRAVVVALCFPLLRLGAYGMTWQDAVVLSWSGLRGAVGLTLALTVYQTPEVGTSLYRSQQIFHMGMMAAFTLVFQGSTTGWLLEKLGYMHLPATKADAQMQAAAAVEKLGELQQKECKERGSVLGEPDWEEVSKLTALGVVTTVKKRPARPDNFLARKVTSKLERSGGAKVVEEEIMDLRERLLSAVKAVYGEMFAEQYIEGPDMFVLQESVEKSMDRVHEGLMDWDQLRETLSEPKPYTKNFMDKMGLQRVRRQFHVSHLRSDATRVSSFIYAHSQARRTVMQFADIGHRGLDVESGRRNSHHTAAIQGSTTIAEEDTTDGTTTNGIGKTVEEESKLGSPIVSSTTTNSTTNIEGGDTNNQQQQQSQALTTTTNKDGSNSKKFDPDLVEDYEPFWHESGVEDKLVHRAVGHLRSTQSYLKRLTSYDSRMLDVVRSRVLSVLNESCRAQAAAEEHLQTLKTVCPEAVQQVRTVQVAVMVLKEEQDFIEKLHCSGALDENEVEVVLRHIEMRMKHMSAIVALE